MYVVHMPKIEYVLALHRTIQIITLCGEFVINITIQRKHGKDVVYVI